MLFKLVIVAIVLQATRSLGEPQSDCDPKIVEKINTLWGNNAPTDIMKRYNGKWTIVKTSYKPYESRGAFKCLQETIDADKSTTRQYEYYKDSTHDNYVDTKLSYFEPGILSQTATIDHRELVFKMYMLYMNDDAGVMANWACGEAGFGAETYIIVKNYNEVKGKAKTDAAIKEAEAAIVKAGVPIPSNINAEC